MKCHFVQEYVKNGIVKIAFVCLENVAINVISKPYIWRTQKISWRRKNEYSQKEGCQKPSTTRYLLTPVPFLASLLVLSYTDGRELYMEQMLTYKKSMESSCTCVGLKVHFRLLCYVMVV